MPDLQTMPVAEMLPPDLTPSPTLETPHTAPGATPRERLRGLVAGILAEHARSTQFSDEDTLTEIGVTSTDMVTLLLSVESTFDIDIPQHLITAEVFRSISTIDAMLSRLLPPALRA